MGFLAIIDHYMNMAFFVLVFVSLILGGTLYYVLKVKKITAKAEKVDYSKFERRNSIEYLKFDDVYSEDPDDMDSPGMIIMGNNVFVGGISVLGFDYKSASTGEKQSAMINAIAFTNVIKQPIQMRQTVKAVDLTHNIQFHEELAKKISNELLDLEDEYNNTAALAEDYVDEPEMLEIYTKQIQAIQRKADTKSHALDEVRMMLKYMKTISGSSNNNFQKIYQIMFSYEFNPADYTTELTQEEIYEKALMELETKAKMYSDALTRCGCSCKRLSAENIVLLLHQAMSPFSSGETRMEDLFNSSYNSLYITSSSLLDFENDKRKEEEYRQRVLEYEKEQEKMLKQQRLRAEREADLLRQQITEEYNAVNAAV